MKAPNRTISPHEMSLILSEIGELPHDSVWEEVEATLVDVGYTETEREQIHREWKRGQLEGTPIIVSALSDFGEGTVSVVPNFDGGGNPEKGVNLETWHQFMDAPAAVLMSAGEADLIALALQRAAAQTRGENPDRVRPASSASLTVTLAEDDHGKMFGAAAEAMAKDAGNVREMATALLLGMFYELGNADTIPNFMFELTNDMIGLDSEMER